MNSIDADQAGGRNGGTLRLAPGRPPRVGAAAQESGVLA